MHLSHRLLVYSLEFKLLAMSIYVFCLGQPWTGELRHTLEWGLEVSDPAKGGVRSGKTPK